MKIKTHEEKFNYLLKKWGYIEFNRSLLNIPVFDFKDCECLNAFGKIINGYYYCSNFIIKTGLIPLPRNKHINSVLIKPKIFGGNSVEEVIALAYRTERLGEQLNLFEEE